MFFKKRILGVAAAAAIVLSASGCAGSAIGGGSSSGPVVFGVSGPVTGQYAYIGAYWKKGFNLALKEINKAGGIDGRTVEVKWEDSQSDPKQALPIAQDFASNSDVVAEIGDFASGASMAASSVYERNKLVQYAFTASSPDFTKGGSYMFAPQMSQEVLAKADADDVASIGGKKVSVLYLDTDWGHATFEVFKKEAAVKGLDIAYSASYLPTTTDFRPLLLKARDSSSDTIVQLGYDADGAALLKQKKTLGLDDTTFFSAGLTQAGLDLAGSSAEGAYYAADWFSSDPDARIADFVAKYKKAYGNVPSNFEAGAYDAIYQLVAAAKKGGATRAGIYDGLKTAELPSIRYGSFTFASDHRPPAKQPYLLQLKNGTPTIVSN